MLVASTAGSPEHAARIAKSTATVRPRGSLKILGLGLGFHEAYLDGVSSVIPHKPSGSPDNRIEHIQQVRIEEIVVPLQPAVVGLVIVAEDQLDQRCAVIWTVPNLPEIADTEVAEAPDELSDKPLVSTGGLVHDLRVTGPDAICGFHNLPAYGPFSMIDTIPSSM